MNLRATLYAAARLIGWLTAFRAPLRKLKNVAIGRTLNRWRIWK